MCGIAGKFGDRPVEACRDQVDAAVLALHHRGPDDRRVELVDEHGAWGMCRLAIRDPSPAGMQPWWHSDVGLVFNGEIYNTAELTKVLAGRGHQFVSNSDTEVLLKTFLEFDTATFGMLDGIFAVAIVDRRKDRLHFARDEFGVKPLFVETTPDGLIMFASEPKALREMGGLRQGVDLANLTQYLRYQYVPEPDTAWLGVRRVPRSTVETYSLSSLQTLRSERFKQPVESSMAERRSADDWVDATEAAIGLSVERQMISDRPLGVFLSGGIDSTIISSFASELHPNIQAFGISVPGWEKDEKQYIREACDHLDVKLTLTELRETDFNRLTDRLLETYDEPFGDFSAIPTMLVSELASKDLRVVLSGDGGDELFGGYQRYAEAPLAELAGSFPAPVARAAKRLLTKAGRGPWRFTERLAEEVEAGGHGYTSMLSIRSHKASAALLGRPDATPQALYPRTKRSWPSRDRALQTAMAIDIEQYLPADINTKVDRATMAFSLEGRVPLLGAPVARLADEMPVNIKVRDNVAKWPLKELLRRRGFSDQFLHRPKMGFSFPMDEWLRRAMGRRPEFQVLLRNPPEPLQREVCASELDSLLGGVDNGHAVWSLLVLSKWLFDQAA